MRRNHCQHWIPALVTALLLAGCATPFSDSDGNPDDARTLRLNVEHSDQLACQNQRQPDCIDWFVLNPPDRGEIQLQVTATNPDGITPDYVVTTADQQVDPLQHVSNEGRREVRMTWSADPGAYYVAVSSSPAPTGLQYKIVAWYQPAASREEPQPRFETTSWMVLEVEAEMGEPRFVVIDGGRRNGLLEGFRGRLIERGRSIAEIEIVDVFDEGSRARIATALVDQITPQTAAEIDVPVGGTP